MAQLENARCSIVGDGAVEFKKRVMILKQGKRYLPSAMELASRRRFQELYQGVLFSKKMEECEVMLQLRKAFEILGNARFVSMVFRVCSITSTRCLFLIRRSKKPNP